jgi:uncharacterized protein (DUF2235 family)
MGRKIILLSDGTGNSSAKIWRTNVWRTFEALDLSSSDQVAVYDDGVGTSAFKPLAALGGAFGFGLKRNVINLYKFACRNYRNPDDEFFAFGFSRGAFTIRVVIGLILDQGLVDASTIDDKELGRRAARAYRNYHREHFHTNWRRIWRLPAPGPKTGTVHVPAIRFLGLWDTVAAYGLPIDEMTQGFSQWIWPLEIPNHRLNDRVNRACHALALDDERTTFHPVLWNERGQARPAGDYFTKDERITQVWFTGMHANVGGGYPDDSLARIPLYWIMEEARACGLRFKLPPAAEPDMVAQTRSGQDKDGRLYNSRSGLGSYYRYGPRKMADLCAQEFWRGDEVYVARPKIHGSVLERIKNNAHLYAPISLPAAYDVVSTVVVEEKNDVYGIMEASVRFKVEALNGQGPYEALADAQARAGFQETRIWNLVAWRALIYLVTVLVTVAFIFYPISGVPHPEGEVTSRFRWFSDLIRLAGSLIPLSGRWVNGYAETPGIVLAFIAAFIALAALSKSVATTITNRMSLAWRQSLAHALPATNLGDSWSSLLRTRLLRPLIRGWKYWLAPALSAPVIAYVAVSFSSHLLYNVQDVAGLTCTPSPKPVAVGVNGAIIRFHASELCRATGMQLEAKERYVIRLNPDEKFLSQYPKPVLDTDTCGADNTRVLRNGAWPGPPITATEAGYTTFPSRHNAELTPWQSTLYFLLLPFRRILDRGWFLTVIRYGHTGGEERYLDRSTDRDDPIIQAPIVPQFDAELFVFLNDATVGLPFLYDLLYRDNQGCVTLFIRHAPSARRASG